jgi:hypothetical protein
VACGKHRRGRTCLQCFGGEALRKTTLAKSRCRCENGIRFKLREMVWVGVEWIRLAHDRAAGGLSCML